MSKSSHSFWTSLIEIWFGIWATPCQSQPSSVAVLSPQSIPWVCLCQEGTAAPASPQRGSVVLHFGRDLSLLSAECEQLSKKKNQHHWIAADCRKTPFLAVTRCGSPACSPQFMFHKKQQLSLFDLTEKSSVRPLSVNLGLAKGHGTARQLHLNSVFVTLAVIYVYCKTLQSPRFLLAASITLSPLHSSSLILCSTTLGNYIHFVSLLFLLPDGQNPG